MTEGSFDAPKFQIEFVVLSFEGPDQYSLVGGLGVRVTEMTRVMARMGYKTRLFFVGDPDFDDYEVSEDGRLHYHRWSRWLSKQYPDGVYHGELAKVEDYQKSLPEFLVDRVVSDNSQRGITTVVIGEDWQTAGTMIRISELVLEEGLADQTILMWNANNIFGFDALDFPELTRAAQVLTVSRYMKERMRALKLQSLVVPNGIPSRYWARVDNKAMLALREALPGLLLCKVGRYHPDKRWLMAVEAVAHCKNMNLEPTLIVRGGKEAHGESVKELAAKLGLTWHTVYKPPDEDESFADLIREYGHNDVIELDYFVPESTLRVMYKASAAVLANSGHEPFGLVGLEVMACGGVAVTGSTGEEYLQSFVNGIALSSDDSRELALYLRDLSDDPELSDKLRSQGRNTAKTFAWESVVTDLLRKIEVTAWSRDKSLERTNETVTSQ